MRWVAGMVRLQVELERERVRRNHQHSPAVDRDLDSRHTALQQVRPATASVCLSVCLSLRPFICLLQFDVLSKLNGSSWIFHPEAYPTARCRVICMSSK